MDVSILAKAILEHVGGTDNVVKNMICVSRLRLELKDEGKADLDAIKAMEGVLGIIETETLQIVIGTTHIRRLGEEFSRLTGIPLEMVEIVCQPGEPCPYYLSEEEGTKGVLGKIADLFKKKK